MSATIFQKLAVDHVPFPLDAAGHGQALALDYPSLKTGRFEAIYFRPEEGADYVAQRIQYANRQPTWRGGKFDGNVWAADPSSSDSIAAGIPGGGREWGVYMARFVKALADKGAKPAVFCANVEFSGKGYPPWRASTQFAPWSKVWAKATDNVVRLYYTAAFGHTGAVRPSFQPTGQTSDGTISWTIEPVYSSGYPFSAGWDWNEAAAKGLYDELKRLGVTGVGVMVQPMGLQSDFNHGAWMSRGARNSPQCYGDQTYHNLSDPGAEIQAIATNQYARLYYGLAPDRRRVHPTLGAGKHGDNVANADFYVPRLRLARERGPFGITLYRHDGFAADDYSRYAEFAIP